jgi:hypothetical protein
MLCGQHISDINMSRLRLIQASLALLYSLDQQRPKLNVLLLFSVIFWPGIWSFHRSQAPRRLVRYCWNLQNDDDRPWSEINAQQ